MWRLRYRGIPGDPHPRGAIRPTQSRVFPTYRDLTCIAYRDLTCIPYRDLTCKDSGFDLHKKPETPSSARVCGTLNVLTII